jgi:transposase
MRYIGLDVHQRLTTVVWLDSETGEMSEAYEVPTAELTDHLAGLAGDPKRAVLEAGTQSHFLARRLMTLGLEVRVVHPFRVRRLFEALYGLKKTDKIDARGLALALADGYLEHAEVWVAEPEIHELRALTRTRLQLVECNVRLRNSIRQTVGQEGGVCPYRDLTGPGATEWLDEFTQGLPEPIRFALAAQRAALAGLVGQIKALSARIAQLVKARTDVALLETIPGIGTETAAAIVAEIGDIRRFKTAAALRGYSGLVPRVDQTAGRLRTGPLTKRGNRRLRRIMILAAQHFVQVKASRDLSLRKWYAAQVFRHGPNPAKVAVARRLLNIIFALLRDGTAFEASRYALPDAA